MNRIQKIALLLTILIVLTTIVALLLATYQNSLGRSFHPRPSFPNPQDFELYYYARTVFSTINIVLITILIVNYVSVYLKTKSEFSIGLLLFAMAFLVKDLAQSPFIVQGAGFNIFGLGPFAFLPDMFEMLALLVLFYLSVKY
jgi:hypothetical protein